MATDDTTIPPELAESKASTKDPQADLQLRIILGDVYSFVRSREVNKTILSFTFDHYIDEAKRDIKEDRILRSASDPNTGVGKRPAKLTSIQKLEQDFNNALSKLQDAAKAADAPNSGSPS